MRSTTCMSLLLITLVLNAGFAIANDAQIIKPLEMSLKHQALEAKKQARIEKRKANESIQKVDINNASLDELKTLPGIGDADAAKIIAGRPYGSKAWLITNKILDMGSFQAIRHLIAAKQPNVVDAKNAVLFDNKK